MCTKFLFRSLTCNWKCFNAENYLKANNCYKIVTCDPDDDTIDVFENTSVGVAIRLAKNSYAQTDYKQLYESLRVIT